LYYIIDLCGYYEPTEEQMVILSDYVNKNYFTLTDQYIKTAFELAINDKLDLEIKAKLSVKEFVKIIRVYKKQYEKKEAFQEPEITQEQKDKIHREWLEYVYGQIENFFKTGDYKLTDYGNPLYNYLDRAGLISFSKEVKEKFHKQVETDNSSGKVQPIKMTIDQSDYLTKKNYKRYALEQFFITCRKEKRDIIAEIKSYEKKNEFELEEKTFK